MRTLPALDDRSAPSSRDHAGKAGFSLSALEALISDCQNQPDWRTRADKAASFYDMGKQLTPEKEHKIRRDWGIEPRQTNLIHGVINGVLGQEAKARSDVKIEADDDEYADVSDVLSAKMKEATREANIDMAVSNGYGSQVKCGVGWVEVSRASDPLDYPYRVRDIHRNEIWWDMLDRDIGLLNGRWQVRIRWEDLDEAVALMPEHKEVLESSLNGWNLFNLPDEETSPMRSAYNAERATTIRRDEWCDSNRRRIKFHEVWYRVPAEVVVINLSPTRRVIYDEKNPIHQQLVARGKVKVSKAITRQVRMALFAGPHRLVDTGTTRRNFPYIPLFAFRDDEDRSPYGMIEGMISPQEEYNERRQMFNWMLLARQVTVDNDALDTSMNTIKDLERSIMRPDFMAVLNANRRNPNGLKIGNDLAHQREQFEAMQDAKQLVQEVPKVYGSQLGNAPAGVTSGIANSLLIEQGIVAMGELNDNYRYARKTVHEHVLDLIVEDHLEEEMQVALGSGSNRRVLVLNSWDPQTGAPLNRVKDAPVKVGLSDVPSSPAFRMQEQQQLATMLQALGTNPQAVALLTPAFIEGSSIANRQALADDLRRATGMPIAGDRQGQQQAQDTAKQQAQQAMQLEGALKESEVKKTEAEIKKLEAETRLANARAEDHEDNTHIALRQQAITEMTPPDQAANEDRMIQDAMREARG